MGEEDAVEARTARNELHKSLLASLQMQHVAVLTGSGCSLGAGGPSMGLLWQEVVGKAPTPQMKALAKKVGHDLVPENGGIEELLSRVEAALSIHSDAALSSFLLSAKTKILSACTDFLAEADLGAHKTFLHRLSRRRARDPRLKVFTTNYDLCFERAAGAIGAVVLDGFSFAFPRRYDPRYYSYDIVRRPLTGDAAGNFLEGVFLLHKLHGSVNWERNPVGVIHENQQPDPANACLIYPARGKYQQSYAQPHLESMAQYLAAIREPNTCVLVTGFGFNDDHLSEPLLVAAESNPHLRLIVTDPGAGTRESGGNKHWERLFRLCDANSDVWLIEATFAQLADLLPNLKSLTPADALVGALNRATGQT